MSRDPDEKIADLRKITNALSLLASESAADFMVRLMDEVEYLTKQLTLHSFVETMNRYHRFDGIKDDKCPCCGSRVRVDESSPNRIRLIAVDEQRAS